MLKAAMAPYPYGLFGGSSHPVFLGGGRQRSHVSRAGTVMAQLRAELLQGLGWT